MATVTPSKKIAADTVVIVAGQRFALGVETDVEFVRQQLVGMGFADVANAEAKFGTDGDTPTIEFVKRAGTKGLTGTRICTCLARVPAQPQPFAAHHTIRRLIDGAYTFQAALDDDVLAAVTEILRQTTHRNGDSLCQTLDQVPAIASRTPRAW